MELEVFEMAKIAVVQKPPLLLDREKTLKTAALLSEEAADNGASIIVFPEAFVPGYPIWIWRLKPGADWDLTEKIHALLLSSAVDLGKDDLDPLYETAAKLQVTIVCGIDEKDSRSGGATLYNTMVVIGPDGRLQNRHRKLMPTNPERMVWGFGDASGLKAVETPCGKIGVLICWENYMPLARYALYAQGIDIYIAPTYDSGDGWVGTMQHIAREGRCWVIGSGNVFKASDIPESFPEKGTLYPDPEEWINPGDSVVVAPDGEIAAGPLRREQAILYSEVDLERVGLARRSLDVVGHYARPDIFKLHVNTQPQSPVVFE
jgi:nitrilase